MAKKGGKDEGGVGHPTISNRKAWHDYAILEEFEAGIVLSGCEVKMVRRGSFQLNDAYAEFNTPKDGEPRELWLVGSNIPPYPQASTHEKQPEPLRRRKLLLHREELRKLRRKVIEKGLTIIPLKAYFVRGNVKVLIALVQGKKHFDKRESIKERDIERDNQRKFK
ncbi:SsrA-binding protein SmpB [bacterium]|nr:SsrA-binding protein SmpB [bacterium]